MNRRSILKAIGIAPMAAPVIARAEAQKAGVSLSGAHELTGGYALPSPTADKKSHRKWLIERIKSAFSPEYRDRIASHYTSWPSRLDPDLASSRSLSLSAALRIQRERYIDASLARERAEVLENYKREMGLEWIP